MIYGYIRVSSDKQTVENLGRIGGFSNCCDAVAAIFQDCFW